MLLENKVAIIYGAGGAVGGAVARAFAREGAKVVLTGRDPAALAKVAKDVVRSGETAEVARVDALDEQAVETHAAAVVREHGALDISFNAIGIPQSGIQGVPLVELPVETYLHPVATYAKAHFITARAAARRMVGRRSGVIMLHTPEPARLGLPLVGGMAPAWAAMESLSRGFSAEVGQYGVRTICLRTTGLPGTPAYDGVVGLHARALGIANEQFQATIEGMTHRRRSTSLAELGDVAAFLASDRAAAMTAAVANLTGGLIAD